MLCLPTATADRQISMLPKLAKKKVMYRGLELQGIEPRTSSMLRPMLLKMHYTTYPVQNTVSNDLNAIDAEPIEDYSLNHSPNFAILVKICYLFIDIYHFFHSLSYLRADSASLWKRGTVPDLELLVPQLLSINQSYMSSICSNSKSMS